MPTLPRSAATSVTLFALTGILISAVAAGCASSPPPLGESDLSGRTWTCFDPTPTDIEPGAGLANVVTVTISSTEDVSIIGVDWALAMGVVTTGPYLFPVDTPRYSDGGVIPPAPDANKHSSDYKAWTHLFAQMEGSVVKAGTSANLVVAVRPVDEAGAHEKPRFDQASAEILRVEYISANKDYAREYPLWISIQSKPGQCESMEPEIFD